MKTIITAWPIDRQLQERIGIYQDSTVPSQSVGRVLGQLVTAGYTEIHSFVENRDNETVLTMHCAAGQSLLDKIRDDHNARLIKHDKGEN